jgi:hypothetical protein
MKACKIKTQSTMLALVHAVRLALQARPYENLLYRISLNGAWKARL